MVNRTNPQNLPGGSKKKRVLLIDDHPVLREGMAVLINQEPDLMVCGEAASAEEAMRSIAALKPDVAVVDISLNGRSGLELLKDLQTQFPKLPTLVLSMHDEALYADRALRAGARGYIMKREGTKKLLNGLRDVLRGKYFISEKVSARLFDQMTHKRPVASASAIEDLSDRELEVFQMLGRGSSTSEVARELHLSVKTIATHRENLKRKLSLKNGSELIRTAILWAKEHQAE